MSVTKEEIANAVPPKSKGEHLLLQTSCIYFLLVVHY